MSLLLARLSLRAKLRDVLLTDARHHRDKRTEAYAAAVLALWRRYQSGELSRSQFETAAGTLVHATANDVVATFAKEYGVDEAMLRAGATAHTLGRFLVRASLAVASGTTLFSPNVEPPSDAMATMRANQAAGPIFAMHWLIEGAAQPDTTIATWGAVDDQNTCSPCSALDGQSWPIGQIPFYPGEGEPCDGELLCRCELTFSGGDFEKPLTLERSAY